MQRTGIAAFPVHGTVAAALPEYVSCAAAFPGFGTGYGAFLGPVNFPPCTLGSVKYLLRSLNTV